MRTKEQRELQSFTNKRCPECRNNGPFTIEAKCLVVIGDDDLEDPVIDFKWKKRSRCYCEICGYAGIVAHFMGEENVTT